MTQDQPTSTIVDQLLVCEEVDGSKRFAQRLAAVLEFTQLLYDDDENLTRVGNLSGVAKDKLQTRILEIFDMADSPSDMNDAEEVDSDDENEGDAE